MERKVGEEFELKLRIKVVESYRTCTGCIFNDSEICGQIEQLGVCDFQSRSDGKNIHFEIASCDVVQ